MSSKKYDIPDGLEKKFIIRPDGKYRSMSDVIEQTEGDSPEEICLSANRDFLEKAGCETDNLIQEAWEMLMEIIRHLYIDLKIRNQQLRAAAARDKTGYQRLTKNWQSRWQTRYCVP